MSETRPVTPPPRQNNDSLRNAQLTPEQVKQIELNRLKGANMARSCHISSWAYGNGL